MLGGAPPPNWSSERGGMRAIQAAQCARLHRTTSKKLFKPAGKQFNQFNLLPELFCQHPYRLLGSVIGKEGEALIRKALQGKAGFKLLI